MQMSKNEISLSDTLFSIHPQPFPLEKSAIEAYANLLNVPGWALDFQSGFRVNMGLVISVGFYLLQLRQFVGVETLRQKIARDAVKNPIDPPIQTDDLSELSAAALCATLGATNIERNIAGNKKLPDFKMEWGSDEVEVEVTHVIEKNAHIDAKKAADEIAAKLRDQLPLLEQGSELVFYLSSIPSQAETETLIQNALNLKPGQFDDLKDKWHVCAGCKDQANEAPKWWRSDRPTILKTYNNVTLDHVHGAVNQLQIHIHMNVGTKAYLNSAQNKADHGQGSKKNPYLVAIDITNLPGAFNEYRDVLRSYWDNWMNISGFLLFMGFSGSDREGWFWELFPNPNAHLPLPKGLLERRTTIGRYLETGVSIDDKL